MSDIKMIVLHFGPPKRQSELRVRHLGYWTRTHRPSEAEDVYTPYQQPRWGSHPISHWFGLSIGSSFIGIIMTRRMEYRLD